jgi:aminocarboxymuconate-semialdehyde decarboxylase
LCTLGIQKNPNVMRPYQVTAARDRGKPGRQSRPSSATVDVHGHVSVPAATTLVEPHLRTSGAPLAFFSNPETNRVNQQQEQDRCTRLSGQENSLAERLHDLDEMGIDWQVVMPPPPHATVWFPSKLG